MKIIEDVNKVELSNVGGTGEFRIRSSARAFSILSSGLYKNKIKAIIRELSTNALDSHVAAGNPDTPFEVHLPTILEPWFSVKDYGQGLDDKQVKEIYTTYFASTKTDSNDYIGALGLGSKSPFSYTENFTITAIKGGTMRIYSAYINDNGVPSIADMHTELSDEPNGVEVKFSVVTRDDYNSFVYEAKSVFKWFKRRPLISGAHCVIDTISYKEKDIIPGVHNINFSRDATAIMGNIAYPLNDISEPEKHFGTLAPLLRCGLVLEFAIGELDFTASREALSYVPMTIDSIRSKLALLNDNLAKHLAKKADAIVNEWSRAEFLHDENRTTLYSAAVIKYVTDTKFELYDPVAYLGRKTFTLDVNTLATDGISVQGFSQISGAIKNKTGVYDVEVAGKTIKKIDIPVVTNAVFVLNDLTTGCVTRARYHYSNSGGPSVTVFCISHDSDDMQIRQSAYDKLLKQLHNPPTVIKASALRKRPVVSRNVLTNAGVMYLKKDPGHRHGYYGRRSAEKYVWDDYVDKLDDNTTYHYVCLNNYKCETPDGQSFDVMHLRNLMDKSCISGISNIKIIGVRKNKIKDIKGLPNWVWIEDKLVEEVGKISEEMITSIFSSDILNNGPTREFARAVAKSELSKSSMFLTFINMCSKMGNVSGDPVYIAELCNKYGMKVSLQDLKSSLNDFIRQLNLKYPLLTHLSSRADTSAVTDYIKYIDSKTVP